MTPLPAHASRYLAGSGVIHWDPSRTADCRLEADAVRALGVAAVLEEDTAISAQHARSFGLDRTADIRAFLPVWELEEAEHGRILRALVASAGPPNCDARSVSIQRRRRTFAGVPVRALGRLPVTGFVYCALGAAAEYLAITSYTALAATIEDATVVSLLHAITRQEGRHLAFFLAAAQARGEAMSPVYAGLARRTLTRIWEPIGVSSLGPAAWRTLNGYWLDDERFRTRVARMDAVLDTLPNLGGLGLMENFLDTWGARSGASPTGRSE